MRTVDRVIIVGGGASGTVVGAALMRASRRVTVTIVEPKPQLGPGTAYATACPLHLLNVPAGRMSAFSDEPEDFTCHLEREEPGRYDAHAFVPRSRYGGYLRAVAAAARESAPERWDHVQALAVDAQIDADGIAVSCADGQTVQGDVLVLATGNAAPAAWP